ncbi:MAG: aminotransferase class III-fold pyridoxal phosphate-dependent enzyme [Ilumatobacter sp.]|uniref:aminotransferase class III-fold pyridoxal phosphate-dependent enzyme n=3 Tax=Ilumatobacter sp. TaxID=1967498 RepID=UPI00329807D8
MTADAQSDLIERRKAALAPAYQLFYDDPVHLVSGSGVWVHDADGRRYLDCYNNVPSVGHCHPRVVAALAGQAALLNTHTRYLHGNVVELAERLGASLAGDLSVCFFVCSGTEAVDLAVEIARVATGAQGVVVTESSYHGNTSLVSKLSTDGYPATDRPDWLGVIEPPNTYRGPFRVATSTDATTSTDTADAVPVGERYAGLLAVEIEALARRGNDPAALLVDTSWDSNGVLTAPDGYVERIAEITRAAGGLVIADEVQAGYCRLGDHFWGHDRYGLIPDIVTIGKPMGAGHPVAAVVTTPEIAATFAERRSYFNTFGGNPVSAAVALAVLDVIDDENLLDNSTDTGTYLGGLLRELATRHEVIGNVQGSGLFWGLDLVADRATRTPMSYDDGRRLATALRHDGILIGLTGRYSNVLKIRPPLVFGREHVDELIATLDSRLAAFELHGGDSRRRPGAEW